MKFKLKIAPAIPIELRHQIGELIEQHGYSIHGQGQSTDDSECDITFSMEEDTDETS